MILALLACGEAVPQATTHEPPELRVSTDFIDFGEVDLGTAMVRTFVVDNPGGLPLGLASVDVGPGQLDNWLLDAGAVTCLEDAEEVPGALLAGCSQEFTITLDPVDTGEIWGSIVLRTADGEGDDPLLRGNADLDHEQAVIELTAMVNANEGRAFVTPRSVDFGTVWEGTEAFAIVDIHNPGDGPLVLEALLADTCTAPFSLHPSWAAGHAVSPGDTALLEVRFAPSDASARACSFRVVSDDADWPELEVTLQGNLGADPNNSPPRVQILSPEPGTRIEAGQDLVLELKVTDVDQPASSLYCRVRSARLLTASVASCVPSQANGHLIVTLDSAVFGAGTDTLQVTALDSQQARGMATVPLVFADYAPASDDDGDAYGPEDCDDSNVQSYPYAVERPDGLDNDCDGIVDEGTIASDDDLDGFAEVDGDCDDGNDQSFPGAYEVGDGRDNDCDGSVDEGTALYDDDGDGVTLSDCDDNDPAVFPGALELCNGIDDDCDNKVDDDCIALTHPPMVVGVVLAEPSGVYAGGTSRLSLTVVDLDGDDLVWEWTVNHGTLDADDRSVAVWTAPDAVDDEGLEVRIVGRAWDASGDDAWAFGTVKVYPDNALDREHVVVEYVEPTGCSAAPGGAAMASMMLFGLALLRRRQDSV